MARHLLAVFLLALALLAASACAQIGMCPSSGCPSGTAQGNLTTYYNARQLFANDLPSYGFYADEADLVLKAMDSIYLTPDGRVCGGPKEAQRLANYMDMLHSRSFTGRMALLPGEAPTLRQSNCYAWYSMCMISSPSTCRSCVDSLGPTCRNENYNFGWQFMINAYQCYYGQAELDCYSRCYLYKVASGATTTCPTLNTNYFVAKYGCNGDCLNHCAYSNRVACSD